jgi:hypothetical protein
MLTSRLTEVTQVKREDGTFIANAVTIPGITANRRRGRLV